MLRRSLQLCQVSPAENLTQAQNTYSMSLAGAIRWTLFFQDLHINGIRWRSWDGELHYLGFILVRTIGAFSYHLDPPQCFDPELLHHVRMVLGCGLVLCGGRLRGGFG